MPALGLPVLGLPKPRLWPGRYWSLELLHYEGQKSVNLPCNTTNTDWTPECNRVEEKSLEEMIMSVNVISASGCENKIRTRGEYENFDTVFI
jgi:hypothetical protein